LRGIWVYLYRKKLGFDPRSVVLTMLNIIERPGLLSPIEGQEALVHIAKYEIFFLRAMTPLSAVLGLNSKDSMAIDAKRIIRAQSQETYQE